MFYFLSAKTDASITYANMNIADIPPIPHQMLMY